jgi:hypothetical protein
VALIWQFACLARLWIQTNSQMLVNEDEAIDGALIKLLTTNFRSSENEFKVLSRVAFATKVCDRMLFVVLLMTKTRNSRPKNLRIGPWFQDFLLNWPEICSTTNFRSFETRWVFSKRLKGFSTF